jgi:hypothetical protein
MLPDTSTTTATSLARHTTARRKTISRLTVARFTALQPYAFLRKNGAGQYIRSTLALPEAGCSQQIEEIVKKYGFKNWKTIP